MSKTIYVGRIPFDYTEEQVADIFRTAGPIQDLRFIFDKETGKSKGFAFIEYFDAEAAASAVRNLDNHPVGHMRLKVDFSNDNNSGNNAGADTNSAFGFIASTVSQMDVDSKQRFVGDFKELASGSRAQALELLQQSPQIAYALVQAMIELGKIDQKVADTLLPNKPADQGNKRSRNKPKTSGNNNNGGGTSGGRQQQRQSRQNTPQVDHSIPAAQAAQAQHAQPAPRAPAQSAQSAGQMEMIRQVMSFTDDQVNMLPPEQRAVVLDIRAKVQRGEIQL